MNSKKLLTDLGHLENQLNAFSFEQLGMEEASHLKRSFINFKNRLERNVLGEDTALNGPYGPEQKLASGHFTDSNKWTIGDNLLHTDPSMEVRALLNIISGHLDVLDKTKSTPYQREHINCIKKASGQLGNFFEDVQEYLNLINTEEEGENLDFNIYRLLNDIEALNRVLIVNDEVQLHLEIAAEVPVNLKGDPSKLAQIVLYLLGNTIKLVNQGDICLKVSNKGNYGDDCLLQFDIGYNRDPKKEAHLKEPSHLLSLNPKKVHGKDEGSKLGIEIIKQLILNQGGAISGTCAFGSDTSFSFSIPYKVITKIRTVNVYGPNFLRMAKEGMKGAHILVLEDNGAPYKFPHQNLQKYGCSVYRTSCKKEAMEHILNNLVDMLILDGKAVEKNNLPFAESIRDSRYERISELPIFLWKRTMGEKQRYRAQTLNISPIWFADSDPDSLLVSLFQRKRPWQHNSIPAPEFLLKLPIVHLKKALRECKYNLDLLEELIAMFKIHSVEFMDNLKLYITQREFIKIELAAQEIQIGLKLMNAPEPLVLVDGILDNCSGVRDIGHIELLYEKFLSTYPYLEFTIDQELEGLKDNGSISD